MQQDERKFLKLVTNELQPLNKIQEKLGWDFETTLHFAIHLEKEKLVRTTSFVMSNGIRLHLVAKPIDKRKWQDKNWILIAVIAYIFGILSPMLSDLIKGYWTERNPNKIEINKEIQADSLNKSKLKNH
jgi:hypothetical protein